MLEELQHQHPHLTLGQIYSALAYYSDHQEEMDLTIEKQLKHVDTNDEFCPHKPQDKMLDRVRLITWCFENFSSILVK